MTPWTWPSLGISDDQGGDHSCSMRFLEYVARVNVDRLPDFRHGCNNDYKLLCKDRALSLWPHVMSMCICYNVFQKPYQSGTNLNLSVGAALSYVRKLDPDTDVVWQSSLRDILLERGEVHRVAEPGIATEELGKFDNWLSNLSCGQPMSMTRFGDYARTGMRELTQWTYRKIALMIINLEDNSLAPHKIAKLTITMADEAAKVDARPHHI